MPASAQEANRVDCFAILTASHEAKGLVLATVTLNNYQAKVREEGIDYVQTKYARLAVNSITATQLHDDLRCVGWWRLAFRPIAMVEGPEEGTEGGLPAFRVGATEALSPDHRDAGDKTSTGGRPARWRFPFRPASSTSRAFAWPAWRTRERSPSC